MVHLQKVEYQYLHLVFFRYNEVDLPIFKLNGYHVPAEHVVWQVLWGVLHVCIVLQQPEATGLTTKDEANEVADGDVLSPKIYATGESLSFGNSQTNFAINEWSEI